MPRWHSAGERSRQRAALFLSAAALAATGCSGVFDPAFSRAPAEPDARNGLAHQASCPTFSRFPAELASPAPDLSGAPDSARRGSEFRIGLRALYALSPGDEAILLEHGTGDGFFILYRPQDSGRVEGDILFEVILERSAHEETGTGYAAEYWRACAGFRWSDEWSKRSEPFLSAGASYSRIEVSGGDLTAGLGLYGGVGVEFLLSRVAAAEIEAKLHKFWAADGSGGGLAVVLAVAAGMRF